MDVVQFHRRPQSGDFSLERLFEEVRAAMPPEVHCTVHTVRFASRGLWKRLYNLFEAMFHQRQINHITGDVHYLALLLRKHRTLLTIPDCASLERLHGWRREVLRLFWYTLPIHRSKLVSVISESTKTELLRHVRCRPEKVRVVPCCLSPGFQRDPQPFRAEQPRILHIGTGRNKNLVRVAEALAGISCRLQVIGRLDAEQEQALSVHRIAYSTASGLSGAEVIAAYRACDLLVFASTYEGFGLPIIEANAVGRPVVTSNVLSMPEAAGDAACLVDPHEVASIRAGIRRVIEDEGYRQALIENGYRNAARFSAETVARKYVELYRELLEHAAA